MTVVVDANILFSALITPNGKIAKVLSYPLSTARFISGHLLVEELLRHQAKIIRYARKDGAMVIEDMHHLLKAITLYNESFIEQRHWLKAERLTNEVDHFDVSYVALTLQNNALLWTGDKKLSVHLKEKGFDQVVNTAELYEMLEIE